MGRLSHSWHLFRTSMGVIKQDKELLWMPILSFFSSVVALMGIGGIGFASGLFPEVSDPERPLAMLLGFSMYIILAFITLFFTAAVVAGANERLAGGDPTVGSSLKAAWNKKGKIFLWSIVVATVNVILQAIRERSGFLGQILSSIAGFAWNLATFFMVPILLFEDKKIGESLRHSGGLFKKTWGESVVGQAGIGLAGMIVSIAVLIVGFLLMSLLGSALGLTGYIIGGTLLVIALIFTAILFATAGGVYKAALYRYATAGQATGGFEAGDLGGQFHAKGTA